MSRKFDVELTIGEDGWWVVECPSLPGCVSQGRTEEEALENIKEAIQACLEVRRELGLPESVIRRTVEIAA
jgi:predicted RNase H-like HicB family nuclease